METPSHFETATNFLKANKIDAQQRENRPIWMAIVNLLQHHATAQREEKAKLDNTSSLSLVCAEHRRVIDLGAQHNITEDVLLGDATIAKAIRDEIAIYPAA